MVVVRVDSFIDERSQRPRGAPVDNLLPAVRETKRYDAADSGIYDPSVRASADGRRARVSADLVLPLNKYRKCTDLKRFKVPGYFDRASIYLHPFEYGPLNASSIHSENGRGARVYVRAFARLAHVRYGLCG
jgi:hypothetical protein